MSNRGKTVISCYLYINNILCVRVYLSNPKTLSQQTTSLMNFGSIVLSLDNWIFFFNK